MSAHTTPRAASLADAARAALERAGKQWTAMRASVLDALAGFQGSASAYDVAEAVSRTHGRRVAANSVYRILDRFVAGDLACRVESANAYITNTHSGGLHDYIFLVCRTCGVTVHIDDDPLIRALGGAAERAGFAPVRPAAEVRGKYSACG